MTLDWSQFRGDYVRWTTRGQTVRGIVREARLGSYQQRVYPELVLQTAEGVLVLSAWHANLMRQLADDPPAIGDDVTIEYLGGGEAKAGQSPVKLFRVEVVHRGQPPRPPLAPSDLV
jgi:hypothetical protein